MLRALLVYSISYLGQDCALRHFHKTDRLDPHICCLGWYPNIYMLHVWESVWKASAAIARFQQNFGQNLLLDEQNSEQAKKQNYRLHVEHYPPVPTPRPPLTSPTTKLVSASNDAMAVVGAFTATMECSRHER